MEEEAHEFFHTSDHFAVDDLLVDFSNDDDEENDVIANSDGADTTTSVPDSSNSSSFSTAGLPSPRGDVQDGTSFSDDLCVPGYFICVFSINKVDELAELEWLSNFVEDSFSTEHVQKLQLVSANKTRPDSKSESGSKKPNNSSPVFNTDVSVPAKARSKRSRTAACNWASRALPMEAFYDNPFTGETIISSLFLSPPSSPTHTAQLWKNSSPDSGADERRCLHCATDKTPQWRTGPMGPKTLCNACGVRYKSGRLVPEYRPVASPTFVLTKHSNSHRKVMELRRQKEMTKSHHDHHGKDSAMILDVSSDGDDYLIHHNVGQSD
ncbi:hypothetical protein Bca52824_019758 [Brassica carinata]|uniref:GATA transcription factor n=1 Tax=Brassica carinata TaxID=52824 RepID=A0A8X7VS52_BRACI|nr:hypothetical protein Bca52824_019758 [Brassica carinata]